MSSQTVVETPSTETLLGCESEEPAPRYPPSKERSLTDLLRREYELATSARPIHPPDTAAKIAQGFPAPAPFWVGLRPFILLMPFTGVGPAVFLMSHGSAAYICCAALLYAYLAFSGYRMGRGDLALAFGRTSSDVHSYAGSPNVIQYLMLMIWLPVWFTSLSCIFSSAIVPKPLLAVAAFWGALFFKNGVCMSVVLHRYASHAAFKYCDTTARDPHSPALMGVINAFTFFLSGATFDDVSYYGETLCCLFVSFTSSWVGMVATLWFNVRNHPIGGAEDKAATGKNHFSGGVRRSSVTNKACDAVDSPNTIGEWPLYVFLDGISSLISPSVGEDDHDHHHTHPNLAVRPGRWGDLPGAMVVGALEAAGLARNVVRQRNGRSFGDCVLTADDKSPKTD
ncbi:hypothetical protein EMIHUDRAFT_454486 [Emiliania huxleyi CCMP1516]|uniref:Uncharacterized protein n=2 Tax=Emiliania huxleyi TaxID=2903 RepID=A0A0D3KU22_EMIH1|nr:hypothetical protein EMIHUDRAFT_454486 [Emiliania huxleyi CCMP1516]EOD39257.1 hypothetical protein EMIHUDRAFT_454486 [Emiliania huxleyi CCMP1516]|eukprot:XP_005791686.1 hypothetical protein EMIHUDRAFT_454486 [Emiliania huxleyi CCMP1516]